MALVNAIMKAIIDGSLVDLKKMEASTNNFPALRDQLNNFSLNDTLQLTGISGDMIKQAASLLTSNGNSYIVCGKDIEEDPMGKDIIEALLNRCALINAGHNADTNSAGYRYSFRSHNNSQG